MTQGTVFDLKRFAVHDGPGIRTAVFLKGCPLRCLWCHNPESQRREPELSFVVSRCHGCGRCSTVCPRGALSPDGCDRTRCNGCGACAAVCFRQARERPGRIMTVAEVMTEVCKDQPFYAVSGGGLTLSGGEPLGQFEFTWELLTAARAAGISTALETCGYAPTEHFRALLPLVDLFLFDLKESDPQRHREYTGVELQPILDNLEFLSCNQAAIILRCPLIPGFNARPEHLDFIARLAERLPTIHRVEIEPYNPLGNAKRTALALSPDPIGLDAPPDDAVVDQWLGVLRAATVKPVALA